MSQTEAGGAWLEEESGRRTLLSDNFTVGRAPANALAINDPEQRVSSYHARFERTAFGHYLVEDRHSTNGTFVNERKVTRQELSDGDQIRFGSRAVFTFRAAASALSASAELDRLDVTTRHYEERTCWFVIGDIKNSSRLASSLDGITLSRLVSDWASRCRHIAERHQGIMANRTGDGVLLLWHDGPTSTEGVAGTLRELARLQGEGKPAFRVLIHRGRATLAGGVRAGEDNVLSSELHQAFRMEKIAKKLGQDMVASEAAAALLNAVLPCHLLPGAFDLPGFSGHHRFFRVG